MFEDEVTEEEQKIIDMRVHLQQQQFKLYKQRESSRQIHRIKSMFEYLRHEEIATALEKTGNDEDAVCMNLIQPDYIHSLRKDICAKHESENKKITRTEEQEIAYNRLLEKRKRLVKKTTTNDAKSRCIRYSRLRLDDALQQLEKADDPEKVFDGWSEARIRAYRQIKTKPNSYYYRFNAPGEKQRNGVWTPEERKLFFKRLAEVGANGQWGLFSMTIPGRVGYQCSNFYRSMLKSGEIQDENYTVDEKGELRYLFGKKDGKIGSVRVHSKSSRRNQEWDDEEYESSAPIISKRKRNHRVGRTPFSYGSSSGSQSSNASDEELEEYPSTTNWNTTSRTRNKLKRSGSIIHHSSVAIPKNIEYENPLPGFIDPITLEEVIRPAISPYGHVMSYNSWLRCLSAEGCKNICPLTKRALRKRELTILTFDNIEEYRDKIANI